MPSKLSAQAIQDLKRHLGKEQVLHEKEDLYTYGYDATPELSGLPDVVVFPRTAEEVAYVVEFANENGLPLSPRGSGTGLSGGSIPAEGGVVAVMTRMNKILEIDEENLTATVEPGVITLDLADAVAARGLFYPPDPGSQKVSTIGGNVAENAGGLRGLKYGVTRDYVMALEAVLMDGSHLMTGGKAVKDVAGYSFRDLLVGSEGTLGIVTQVTVSLIPPPKAKKTMVAYFKDVATAGQAVSEIVAAKIIPATLEILDNKTINSIEDYVSIGLPREMQGLLLIETDGHPAEVEEEAAEIHEVLERVGADVIRVAQTDQEAEDLTAARRTALSALARVSPTTILEDSTVPRSELASTFNEIARLTKKYNLTVGTFGHAGDGNLHPTALTDERNSEEIKRVHAFFSELYDHVLAVGGTVSGEHGIGMAKVGYLERQIGSGGVKVMRRIKHAFDPEGRLNPGKMFTPELQEEVRA